MNEHIFRWLKGAAVISVTIATLAFGLLFTTLAEKVAIVFLAAVAIIVVPYAAGFLLEADLSEGEL